MGSTQYPRYPAVREVFVTRATELGQFLADSGIGGMSLTQAELTYINAIDVEAAAQGDLSPILRHWRQPAIHIGAAEAGTMPTCVRHSRDGQASCTPLCCGRSGAAAD